MKETQTACQAWWVEKDLFLPMFSYEGITLHDPAFGIAMLTKGVYQVQNNVGHFLF